MKVSYYPGCSLDGTAKEYGESTEAVCKMLGIELKELDDWNCCGSSSAHVVSDSLAVSLPAKNLEIADKVGLDVVVPCAACYQRLKMAEKTLKAGNGDEEIMVPGFRGNYKIRHLVDFLWEDVGEKAISEKIKKSLKGLKPICYYGCLTVRPPPGNRC
ncbi:heterodisulfide reductase-related iron-sulfur binding cluster [Chloroflexota bacterium]